jgi:hypothetical protein
MKHFLLSILVLGGFANSIFAQAELDAYKMARNDLKGTARSVSMGGAFGALGGDVSGIAVNPAGIGVYKSSEITATASLNNNQSKAVLGANELKDNKFSFKFDNMSYVGVFPINSNDVPFINFGFSYNRLKNFDRRVAMSGNNMETSITDYMAYRAGNTDPNKLTGNDVFWSGADWLGIFGYNSYLINPNSSGFYDSDLAPNENVNNHLRLYEEGSISSYDFNIGTTISDVVSLGLTLAVTDIDYYLKANYSEQFGAGGNFDMENILNTKGSGFQVKVGTIIKPVQQLRIGVSYHSPTWYEMSDGYSAGTYSNRKGKEQNLSSDWMNFDYNYRTPDKWVFSLAGIIGKYAILSADYEITNYGNMTLSYTDGWALDNGYTNERISSVFKTSSTLRVGAEVRFSPRFSGRVGYSWVESPFDKSVVDGNAEIITAGSMPHFTIDGSTNYFTYGLGYKFTPSFYADVAFVLRNQKDDLYSFSKVPNADGSIGLNSTPAKLTTNTFGGVFTLGYRF